ncbi:MAG: uroporphyrinogen-III synthase [Burkholderiales bacterium]
MNAPDLAGRAIVVTRPAEQARALVDRLQAIGAEPVAFPAIEIGPPAHPAAMTAVLRSLARPESFDLAIFVSPTAVACCFAALRVAGLAWPTALRTAAIGEGSAQALYERGITAVLVPQASFDSEGLLATPALAQPAGRRIAIVRGDGGRDLLGDTLRARGAVVEYVTCYARSRPATDPAPLVTRWAGGHIDAVNFTSSEGLGFFVDIIGAAGRDCLVRTPTFVSHPRIADTAKSHGIHQIVTTGPGDDRLIAALGDFFAIK